MIIALLVPRLADPPATPSSPDVPPVVASRSLIPIIVAGEPRITEIVLTDAGISSRLAAPKPPHSTWETIDDHELVGALAGIGLKAGLVDVNGRAMLIAARQ